MVFLIAIFAFSTIFAILYVLLSGSTSAQNSIEVRLKGLDSMKGASVQQADLDEELAKPFSKRILSPIIRNMSARLMRFTPHSLRLIMEERIAMAGGFGNLNVDEFFLLCGCMAICLPGVIALLLIMMKAPANKVVGLGMIAFVVGLILPFLIINQKIAARKLSIQKDLPDVLDLLTVSVEAGLGFDGALAKLTEKMKGALVEEFQRVLQEIRVGVSRREALVNLGKRCNVPDLSLFTTSLIQADQLGVSISNVLRVQSAGMRNKRKQRAEEKAMKAPIKMMLPLVLFIFPTIFIVLLGPAVIQTIQAFSGK